MDGKIDKVREALIGSRFIIDKFTMGTHPALKKIDEAIAALSAIDPEVKRKEAIDAFRMDELDAVMVSVDKWLPDNYPTGINPATRAAAAREIALKAIEKFDPEAIRRAQRMKSLLQSISSWFACWGIATKDDLGQSVEEFDREITAILSAEPAQDERPRWSPTDIGMLAAMMTGDIDKDTATLTAYLSDEPAQDDGKPDAFASAIVKELRVNWAFDTDDALSVLNGAERRVEEAKE